MAEDIAHGQFNKSLCDRVKRLREDRGLTSEEMAKLLHIPAERYRKYESRSPLPHYLVENFALIVGRDIEYVLTGKLSPIRGPSAGKGRKAA